MPGFSIEIDNGNILRALRDLQRAVTNTEHALREIGEHLLMSTDERLRAGIDPEGDAYEDYAPLHPKTIAKKQQNKDKILIETGQMMNNSLSYDTPTPNELIFGSSARQSRILQYGGFTYIDGQRVYIPERPFIGISDADSDAIVDILRDYINQTDNIVVRAVSICNRLRMNFVRMMGA